MVYDLTNITNANTLPDIIKSTSDVTGGVLMLFVLFSLFVVYLVVMKKQSFKVVFLAGNFFTTIAAVFMFGMGWITLSILMYPLIFLFSSLLIYYFID